MQKRSGTLRTRAPKTGKRAMLGAREKRRLIQLVLCVGLFLAVFMGRGIAPEGVFRSGETLLQLIRSDTDFRGAFSALGETLSNGGSITQGLGDLVKEVFGTGIQEQETMGDETNPDAFAIQTIVPELSQLPTHDTMLMRFGVEVMKEERAPGETAEGEVQSEADTLDKPEIPAYTGPALPAGATMEYADLGLADTVTPVWGELTSAYGYRDHPVDGTYQFHTGVDLAVDTGTPVAAFAAGIVDFIGESEAYGLYIQIDHGNDVTTFYCHCNDLYARKGEAVSAGQIIAAAGATGNATGPHLHLELEKDDVLLNPLYYIETAG